jgi:hypothetical protein
MFCYWEVNNHLNDLQNLVYNDVSHSLYLPNVIVETMHTSTCVAYITLSYYPEIYFREEII